MRCHSNANHGYNVAGNQNGDAAAHRRHARLSSGVWNARDLALVRIDAAFAQNNHVRNLLKGKLRGLHYQMPSAAQSKLMRVTGGTILDVAVDARRGSPTFGHHAAVLLTA